MRICQYLACSGSQTDRHAIIFQCESAPFADVRFRAMTELILHSPQISQASIKGSKSLTSTRRALEVRRSTEDGQ
jgi:hypothetical protein